MLLLLLSLFLSFIRFFIALRVHTSFIAFIFHHLRIIIDNERKTNCGCSRLIATEYHISHKTQVESTIQHNGKIRRFRTKTYSLIFSGWNRTDLDGNAAWSGIFSIFHSFFLMLVILANFSFHRSDTSELSRMAGSSRLTTAFCAFIIAP